MTVLPKSPSGIRGLDEITNGGLPAWKADADLRPCRLRQDPSGHGVSRSWGPRIRRERRVHGVRGDRSRSRRQRRVARVRCRRADRGRQTAHRSRPNRTWRNQESGEYDLEGLFIRLDHAITSIGAKRVVLDTVETLFSGFPNLAMLRAELRRLFRWLKDKGITAIITGERGENTLTRYGIEEYVSDCVIVLDHRVNDQMSTRRLRIAKYRGSSHGTNEYPFLIDESGISILPLTSMNLAHKVSTARIPSGIPRLDSMLGGEGYYRGSSILVSGTAGSGKTSIAAHFVDAACRRGERCLYFLFEESPEQVMRNMRSIGIDLQHWAKKGLLQFHAARPSLTGLEMHLAVTLKAIRDFAPRVVVIDPLSAFTSIGRRTRNQGHDHAGRRFPEDERHHRAVHQSHCRRHRSRYRARELYSDDRHMASAA